MLRSFTRVSVALSGACLTLLFTVPIITMTQARSIEDPSIDSAAAPAAIVTVPPFTITEQQVIPGGLSLPVHIANAHDGSQRLFVVEQGGLVRVVRNGVLLDTPFITLTSQVSCCNEQGLLSIAFDPDYAANGTFYVDYTNNAGDTNVERYIVSDPASDVAGVIAATKIITIDQPEPNHNGGQLQFGPDGYLYIGTGDGGGGGDQHGPTGNAQNPAVLLGKILRINVHGVPTYSIPSSNPFTQTAGYRPEIWALGLRNPWRFSFDRLNGDLYIGATARSTSATSTTACSRRSARRP
jgi:glucose/arabinose dehydrogenase